MAVVIDVFSRPSSLLLHALNHRLVASPTPAPDPVTRDGAAPPTTTSTYLQVDSDNHDLALFVVVFKFRRLDIEGFFEDYKTLNIVFNLNFSFYLGYFENGVRLQPVEM